MTEAELDLIFKELESFKDHSSDSETKVAALIFSDHIRVKATNHFVTNAVGLPSVRPDKYEYIVHAEQNAIFHAASRGIKTAGTKMFCTLSPCQPCIRAMFQAGIREVYYKEVYRAYDPNMRDIEITETKVGPYTRMVLTNYAR